MSIEITEMTAADCDEVVSFWQRQDDIGLNESDTPNAIAAFLNRNPGMSFIVRDGRRIIAAVLCSHDGRRGYLHHLAVNPAHRRQGIGRSLVQRCLDRLLRERILKCNIFLFAGNSEGKAFWQAVGFRDRTDLKVMQRITGDTSQD
ncbi:MAG: GNAT family N-acetyltransferase [Thermoguttaceae bacterium]